MISEGEFNIIQFGVKTSLASEIYFMHGLAFIQYPGIY